MRLDVREDANQLTVGLVWSKNGSRPPTSLVLTELLFIVTLARIGTRELIQPQSVTTTAPPTDQVPYVDFLGIRIQKGKRHSVVFSRSDADRSFLTSNEGLWSAFAPELRTRLAQLAASVTIGPRVRSVLLEALPGGGIEMEDVARRVGMSSRSLQRYLETEGLTYTKLLQSTRHALAEHYLMKTDLPVAEISFLLGFEEPNSFFRAFRGWCGQSPVRFRDASQALLK